MRGHDIVVIGASAGGVEALAALAAGLPEHLPAAVFVVVHFPSFSQSVLPRILSRAGPLPAAHAEDGEEIHPGRIYVAPPDRHLLVRRGRVRVVRGPSENGHRPAVDPLFRTAARAYGPRVVGVVLTGNLDDGTAGLVAVKRQGGVSVVQHPDDALYDGMPTSALRGAPVDHVLPVSEIASLLVRLARTHVEAGREPPVDYDVEEEADVAEMRPEALFVDERPGEPSGFTCPECHGAVWETEDDGVLRFRCRVGHAYSPENMVADQGRDVEAALWIAFRALRERSALCRRVYERMSGRGQDTLAARYRDEAADAERKAVLLRGVLMRGTEAAATD
ncbi:MAG TPA: chemotaxis protein CheB [Longimicrobium sp.]|nr:chemotaxis protein CheB [Longimicrobium sp.]